MWYRLFRENIFSIITGFLCGATLFFLFSFSGSENFSANLSIPYSNTDAGLEVEVNDSKIISENAPNNDMGAKAIVTILTFVFTLLKSLLGFFVVFWIVWSGVYILVGSTTEDQVKTGKQMLKYSLFGLVAMLLGEPFVLNIFYGGGDTGISYMTSGVGNIQASADNLRSQVSGIMDFVKTILIFVAMGYVIKAGSQMIFSHGDDEQVTSAKNIAIPMFFGFLLVLFNEVFIDQVLYKVLLSQNGNEVEFQSLQGNEGVSQFVREIVGFLQYIFEVLSLLLLGFILYGGFTIMTSLGDDEKIGKGKTILFNALIGMVVVLISFVLMWSLVNFEV